MKPEILRNLAQKHRKDGKTYKEIGNILNITDQCARNLCRYSIKKDVRKRGPKFKLQGLDRFRIRREVTIIKTAKEKVTTTKIITNCRLNISKTTTWRELNRCGFRCKKAKIVAKLLPRHKESRINHISDWITNHINWTKTIFTDEKRFSLDGPDCFVTYCTEEEEETREIRCCEGGGVFVWLMLMPNGLISHHILNGKFNSTYYINLLRKHILPILNLNFGNEFIYQEDNSPIHKSKLTKDFMKKNEVKVLEWPPKSGDINLVEDVWRIISEKVYDGPQFYSKATLTNKINEVIYEINNGERSKLFNLYSQLELRFIMILRKNGAYYNK